MVNLTSLEAHSNIHAKQTSSWVEFGIFLSEIKGEGFRRRVAQPHQQVYIHGLSVCFLVIRLLFPVHQTPALHR